jgi:hypothetical protein
MGEPIEPKSSDSMIEKLLPQIQILESQITDLEEKIDYAQSINQPYFHYSNELSGKRAELAAIKKYIENKQ